MSTVANRRVIACVSIAVLSLMGCEKPVVTPPSLEIAIDFRCKWWSEEQMARFDPNAPPPKTEERSISKWEYTDPVGVPHPDTVDVVVWIRNTGTTAVQNINIELLAESRVGPQAREDSASWTARASLHIADSVSVAPGDSVAVRTPYLLQAQMTELEKRERWPFELRITAEARATRTSQPLKTAQRTLPIRPGD